MKLPQEEIIWGDHGLLAGRSDEQTWQILFVAALTGAVIIAFSYRFSLVRLSPWRRAILVLLRLSAWLAILAILAAPTRIRRTYDQPTQVARPFAVLVDRSESMLAKDNREQRRLDDALLQWRRVEPAAVKAFGSLSTFVFAQNLSPAFNVQDARPLQSGRTDLFAALRHVLAQKPEGGWGGIAVLTDGLDTSGTDAEEARRAIVSEALGTGTPLYFVVGRNRVMEPDFFRIKEFNVPAKTVPNSVVRLNAIFESSRSSTETLPIELRGNDQSRPAGNLRLEAGRRLSTWNAETRAEDPGVLVFELRVGTEIARAEMQVERPRATSILYLQGKQDWGYRFFLDALSGKDAPSVTFLIENTAPAIIPPPGAIKSFPKNPDLGAFGFVVLDNTTAAQVPAERQLALSQWVKEGGTLLFLASDGDALRHLPNSELEKLLPVVFAPPPLDLKVTGAPPVSLVNGLTRVTPAVLTPFAWENKKRVQEIFGDIDSLPEFATWTRVARPKPGAEIVARHPSERGPDGQGAILLAVQSYGRGKTVALATDGLWRWRLRQPSNSPARDRFWITFLTWLNRDREPAFRFEYPPVHAPKNTDVTLNLADAKAKTLEVEASLGGQKIPLSEIPGDESVRKFRWRPTTAGLWQIEARDADKNVARAWLTVDELLPPAGELPSPAPNEALLRSFAAETSGAILGDPPASWNRKVRPSQLLSERREPLWQRGWVMTVLLLLFGTEMILRRRWQLL